MSLVQHAQTNLQLYEQLADRPAEELRRIRDAYELATRLFAGHYRGCGKPFVAHLVGTASVLARHGAPLPVLVAALLHAAYAQGDFGNGRRGMTPRKRRRLREAVGEEAEELVAQYSTFDWSRVPDAMAEEDRPVVLLRIANEVDECVDRGLLYVGSKKRDQVANALARYVDAARSLGEPALAEELEDVAAENRGVLPEGLAGRDWSYTIDPPLRGTVHRRLRALRRSLRPSP